MDKNTIQIEESRIVDFADLKQMEERSSLGDLRVEGNLEKLGFHIPHSDRYDWVLVEDCDGELVLLPLKKTEKNS